MEAGVNVLYKHGRKLVSDRTAKSRLEVERVTETQFADDVALYATSHDAFETMTVGYDQVADDFGLKLSIEKTKGLIISEEIDPPPVRVEGGILDIVDHFSYLGLNISRDGEVTVEIGSRIAKASRALGCLKSPVFQDRNFSIAMKRQVYKAVVLSALLYGAETWTLKAPQIRQLDSFHNCYVRTILGITRYQQWKEITTTQHLAAAFGMKETISDLIMEQQLRWLGHMGRMDDTRLPKKVLIGELKKKRPCHGTKRRWRDVAKSNVEAIGISERWYKLHVCQDRKGWLVLSWEGVENISEIKQKNVCPANARSQTRTFICDCGRSFRRKGDLTRHSRFCSHCNKLIDIAVGLHPQPHYHVVLQCG